MSRLFIDDGNPNNGGKKIMLATPVYSNPDASYTFAMSKTRQALHDAGFQTAYALLSGNCHVDDARNTIVREFLNSDCTNLVFLDADVSWDEGDLVTLCSYDLPIVGGVYGFRGGEGDSMPFRSKDGAIEENGLLEVEGLPTGFMKIQRQVLEDLANKSQSFYPKNSKHPVHIIFERTLIGNERWGGDLNFCRKAAECGHKIYACLEMRFKHVGTKENADSLGAFMRRKAGITLPDILHKVKNGTAQAHHLEEAVAYVNNAWGVGAGGLMTVVAVARKAKSDILEAGSGLTTLFMAAACSHKVYCLEHDAKHARWLREQAKTAGLENIVILEVPIKEGWYCLDGLTLPDRFAAGFNDGPPRVLSKRIGFLHAFGERMPIIVCDDVDNHGYATELTDWCKDHEYSLYHVDNRTAVLMRKENAQDF